MKFAALLLLGFCGLVAAGGSVARPGNQIDMPDVYEEEVGHGIFDGLKPKVDELVSKAQKDFEIVAQKAKELALKVHEKLLEIGQTIKGKLDAVKADIVKKVNAIKGKGEEFQKCVEPVLPEFEKIEQEAGSNFEACAKDVSDEYNKFQETVHKDVEELKSEVEKFNEEVKDCFSFDIIAFIKCIKTKMQVFEELFKSFKATSLDAISIGHDIAEETLKEVDNCNRSVAKKILAGVTALNQKLAKCYKL